MRDRDKSQGQDRREDPYGPMKPVELPWSAPQAPVADQLRESTRKALEASQTHNSFPPLMTLEQWQDMERRQQEAVASREAVEAALLNKPLRETQKEACSQLLLILTLQQNTPTRYRETYLRGNGEGTPHREIEIAGETVSRTKTAVVRKTPGKKRHEYLKAAETRFLKELQESGIFESGREHTVVFFSLEENEV